MREDSAPPRASGSVRLLHANGMHARPAIKLTKLAKRFRSSVAVGLSAGGPWVDAKSVARIMAMKTPSGVTLYFSAEGSDARAAVEALIALVAADFVDTQPGAPTDEPA
jgi:phosphocarrier protein HPr